MGNATSSTSAPYSSEAPLPQLASHASSEKASPKTSEPASPRSEANGIGQEDPSEDFTVAPRVLRVDRSRSLSIAGTQKSQRSSRSSCDMYSTSSRTKSKGTSILDEDDLVFAHGPQGLQLLHSRGLQRTRAVMRELGQNMLQSMTAVFPRQVWDACEIPHPEQEREEKAQAQMEVNEVKKVRAAEKAAEKIRSLEAPIFRSLEVSIDGKCTRRTQTISYCPERQEDKDKLHQEQVIAWLARQTGWSVLDVEEMREIFHRHAVGGRVDVHSGTFKRLLSNLYAEPSPEEVQAILRHVTKARQRVVRRSIWQSITHAQQEEETTEPTRIFFNEFYLGLVRWLDHQKTKTVSQYCRLSRFQAGDRVSLVEEEDAEDTQHVRKEVAKKGEGGRSPSSRSVRRSVSKHSISSRQSESMVSEHNKNDAEDKDVTPKYLSEDESYVSETARSSSGDGDSDPGSSYLDDSAGIYEAALPAAASFVV